MSPRKQPNLRRLNVRCDQTDYEVLQVQAAARRVAPTTLLRMLIADWAHEEQARQRAREAATASRAAQGLPPTVEDAQALAAVAAAAQQQPPRRARAAS
jgi:hypothetical protein